MNLILSLEQEKFIQSQIATGKYANKQQVIETALTLLQQQTQDYEQWLEETRAKVKVGLNQLTRGEKVDGEIAIAQLKEKFKQQ
ncbi:MAG: type II toxin-antitoxin system ParD family antitoxin [Microcystaceae cyanobacterium]